MRKLLRPYKLMSLLFLVCSVLMFQNCAQHEFAPMEFASEGLGSDEDPVSNPPNVICDPFGSSTQSKPGIAAELYYYDGADASSQISNLNDIFTKGKKLEDTLVLFSSIYVPTRKWTSGFDVNAADKVKDGNGNDLIEWFGLDFKSKLKLMDSDDEGLYQFATISDDGSLLMIDSDGSGLQKIVDNDGYTSTRMRCGSTVSMKRGVKLPMQLQYFQGPRDEIAMTLLWRKVAPGMNLQSYGCNANLGFFSNGLPTEKFDKLVAEGWQVIPAGNFETQITVPNVCE